MKPVDLKNDAGDVGIWDGFKVDSTCFVGWHVAVDRVDDVREHVVNARWAELKKRREDGMD